MGHLDSDRFVQQAIALLRSLGRESQERDIKALGVKIRYLTHTIRFVFLITSLELDTVYPYIIISALGGETVSCIAVLECTTNVFHLSIGVIYGERFEY